MILLSNQVLDRNLDVFEGYVGGSASPYTLAIHLPRTDTAMLAFNQETGDTVHALTSRTDSSSEVVAPHTIGDPLLFSIDNIMLSILGELGFACEIGNIAARIRLGNGKTYPLVAVQDGREYSVNNGFFAELDKRWATDTEPSDQIPYQATTAGSGYLIGNDQFVKEVPLLMGNTFHSMICQVAWVFMKSEQAS